MHGAIDGFSRLISYLRATTQNDGETSLHLFLRRIISHGLPSRVRTDHGPEYNMLNILSPTG